MSSIPALSEAPLVLATMENTVIIPSTPPYTVSFLWELRQWKDLKCKTIWFNGNKQSSTYGLDVLSGLERVSHFLWRIHRNLKFPSISQSLFHSYFRLQEQQQNSTGFGIGLLTCYYNLVACSIHRNFMHRAALVVAMWFKDVCFFGE